MGVGIRLDIAKSVTKEDWEKVYNESLKLMQVFPLAEKSREFIHGADIFCLIKTRERFHSNEWKNGEKLGWRTSGNYDDMSVAENYYLPRELFSEDEFNPKCNEAMIYKVSNYFDSEESEKRFGNTYDDIYNVWCMKTQGKSYHIYLLAVACLIESRLGEKAYVYGDITRGQCIKAIELANRVLEQPIDLPVACVPDKLIARLREIDLTECERLKIFISLVLINHDANFGKLIRDNFSSEAFDEYWRKRLGEYTMNQIGFTGQFHNYMLWGFEFDKIFQYIKFEKDDNKQYEKFVEIVMDSKLHIKEKDCSEPTDIDQDASGTYSVYTLMAQFMLAGLKNPRVDRYIPLETIRKVLKNHIGDKCDTDMIIDACLGRKKTYENGSTEDKPNTDKDRFSDFDPSDLVRGLINHQAEKISNDRENYDITDYDDLITYKKGNTIEPHMEKEIKRYFSFYNNLVDEKDYKELMESSLKERYKFLVYQNKYLLLRDKDWEKIFDDMENDKESYARYYPMVRVKATQDSVVALIKAIATNDEFYEHCNELLCENENE